MKITKKNLQSIDLSSLAQFITNEESKNFFLADKEHYKLLAYLSTLQDGIEISDIGTFRGCSALALSYNPKNKVTSYDVSDSRTLNGHPENIEFKYVEPGYFSNYILFSNIIFLDILHDGISENEIYQFLKGRSWEGILVLDDIHLNAQMEEFWASITEKKEDLTKIGHWSGTGIVYFR